MNTVLAAILAVGLIAGIITFIHKVNNHVDP